MLDRDRIGGIAATPLRCPATPRARCPHQGLRLNAGDIDLPQLGDARAQLGVVAEAGINQHQIARKAHLTRPANLIERDLRFGLEADIFRHSRLAPTTVVLAPVLRQIQPIAHRQARSVVGKRQRYCHLAVRLLAKLPAILVRHPDRMPSLLGKARIVDDPRLDRSVTLDRRQHHLTHLGQHRRIRPPTLANEMQQ